MYNLIYTTNVILALYEYILQPQTTSSFREAWQHYLYNQKGTTKQKIHRIYYAK